MAASSQPVARDWFAVGASPREAYEVVIDFPAYPRLFPEMKAVTVLQGAERRWRVEFRVGAGPIVARYVLDIAGDPDAHTVEWTFVEGDVVKNSVGGWRFVAEPGGTRIHYRAAMTIDAPLPGFILRRVESALIGASLPAMFASIAREIERRRARRP